MAGHRRRPAHACPQRPLFARAPWLGLGLAAVGGLVFWVLAYNVRTNGPLLAWDEPICRALHKRAIRHSRFAFAVIRFSAWLGREYATVITAVLAVVWLYQRSWRRLTLLLVGVIGGNTWFVVLSRFFGRKRPVFGAPFP